MTAAFFAGDHVLKRRVGTWNGGRATIVALRWLIATVGSLSILAICSHAARASTETPHIVSAIEAARRHSLDARVFLAIGWHESRLNPQAGSPMQKGRHMSSAIGMWQILAAPDTLRELGISRADRTNYDRATPAIAHYFARQQERLRQMGIDPTPGKTYMTWNVGPGMTAAILNAKPSERIESIARRMLAKYGRRFIAKWLRNNPSLYRPGMTASRIAANYELQMAKDMRAVDRYLTPRYNGVALD
jgi:soluble lytic murein transglycosylase-like protein